MRDTKASWLNCTSVSIRKAFVIDQISVSGSSQSNKGQGGYNSEGDTNKTLNLQSNTMEPCWLELTQNFLEAGKGVSSSSLGKVMHTSERVLEQVLLISRPPAPYFYSDQMPESDQRHTYPSPNSTLTLALYQLTAVGLGEEYVGAQILTMIHSFHQSPYFFACTPNLNV